MGKAAGVSRRRKKTASHRPKSRKVLKRQRRAQLKKTGGIACDELRDEWNMQRSMKTNMAKVGLSHDPNYTMAREARAEKKVLLMKALENVQIDVLPKTTSARIHEKMLKQSLKSKKKKMNANFDVTTMDAQMDEPKKVSVSEKVITALEKKAAVPPPKNFRFGPDNIEFCIYMIQRYGEDYQAMVRDKRNYYQESAGQIKTKIRKFLAIPEHQRTYEHVMDMFEEQYDPEEFA